MDNWTIEDNNSPSYNDLHEGHKILMNDAFA